MDIRVIEGTMTHKPGEGYFGQVQFHYKEHGAPYEMFLFSKNQRDWDYSLRFAAESGKEEEILIVEERLEQDEDFFYELVDAAYGPEAEEDEPSSDAGEAKS